MKKPSLYLFACLLLVIAIPNLSVAQRSAGASRAVRAQAHDPETLRRMIEQAALEAGISPHLLSAVVRQESSGKWWVVSPKGARGLAQLMPGTAARFGVRNSFDPMQNLRGGAKYLRYLLDYFKGDVKLALAGYNAGEGAVMKFGRRIPPYRETQNYVAVIYPRFVREATANRQVMQTSLIARPAVSSPGLLPVVVSSKAKARELAASGRSLAVEIAQADKVDPAVKGRTEEAKTATRSTGASVYFWPAPARLPANLIPQ